MRPMQSTDGTQNKRQAESAEPLSDKEISDRLPQNSRI